MQQAGKSAERKIHPHLVWVAISLMVVAGSFAIGFSDMSGKDVVFAQNESDQPTYQRTSALISNELATFFESFDRNKDGRLQFTEAEAFYYWMEKNIEYRSDDEGTLFLVPGAEAPKGDGRYGEDYRQTPTETFEERAGDCEDMATLALAFYYYFGVEAYMAGVNALTPNQLDHAVAVVRLPDDLDTFTESVERPIHYYQIGRGVSDIYGENVSPGAYMVVDNAYSDSFGYVSSGLQGGTYKVHCLIPLKYGYMGEWDEAVTLCLSSL